MNLNLVIERECSRDHQTALRQFLCCKPGDPEWAMDPQRYIRGLCVRKTPTGVMRTLLVVSGDIPLHDEVVGFCEYGVGVETTKEHEGIYQISYIATALKVRGQHLGDTLLTSVIMRLRDDAWRSNRTPLVLTQVDPRNKPSMDLFSRFGFVDEGPDPNDLEYHLLSLKFTGTNYVIGDQQDFPAAFHRNIPIAFVRDLFGLAVNT